MWFQRAILAAEHYGRHTWSFRVDLDATDSTFDRDQFGRGRTADRDQPDGQ
jgi:hypothetical protein